MLTGSVPRGKRLELRGINTVGLKEAQAASREASKEADTAASAASLVAMEATVAGFMGTEVGLEVSLPTTKRNSPESQASGQIGSKSMTNMMREK